MRKPGSATLQGSFGGLGTEVSGDIGKGLPLLPPRRELSKLSTWEAFPFPAPPCHHHQKEAGKHPSSQPRMLRFQGLQSGYPSAFSQGLKDLERASGEVASSTVEFLA